VNEILGYCLSGKCRLLKSKGCGDMGPVRGIGKRNLLRTAFHCPAKKKDTLHGEIKETFWKEQKKRENLKESISGEFGAKTLIVDWGNARLTYHTDIRATSAHTPRRVGKRIDRPKRYCVRGSGFSKKCCEKRN